MRAAETDSDALATAAKARSDTARTSAAVSLVLTVGVVFGTVIAIYSIFPNRWAHLADRAIEAHREVPPASELAAPGHAELVAWGRGVLGGDATERAVPWPGMGDVVEILAARSFDHDGRRVACAVFSIDSIVVTVVASRRDYEPGRRANAGDVAIAWRDGPWTIVAVGPVASESQWRPAVGAP